MNVGNNHDLCFCSTFKFTNDSSVLSRTRIEEWIRTMFDFNFKSIENSDTGQNHEHDEKFKTNMPDKIVKTGGNAVPNDTELIDTTDEEQEFSEIDEENNMSEENLADTKSNKIDKFNGYKLIFFKFITFFNKCFTCPRTYIFTHVNINADLISKEDSEKRVIWLLTIFAFLLDLTFSILIITLSLYSSNDSSKYEILTSNTELEVWPVVQKLVVIFGDGTSIFLVMYKSLELAIIQDLKFNFNKTLGFFAYDQINHIQTLVGDPNDLNYMHYSKFYYKKIPG